MTDQPRPVGARVLCWPGAFRRSRSFAGTVISEPRLFGNTATQRVRADDGHSDYIALSHMEALDGGDD
jgi:hypothetical protein